MAGWSGFTEEDLHRLKKDSEVDVAERQKRQNAMQQRTPAHSATPANEKSCKPHQHRRKMPLKQQKDFHLKDAEESGIAQNNSMDGIVPKVDEILHDRQKADDATHNSHADCKVNVEPSKQIDDPKKNEEPDLKLIADEDLAELELNNLEQLQKRQKEIEEENRKKKQIINETINQRFKKAQNEASTLQNVQKELVKLDCLLAKDVEILRTKIEEATAEFSSAQKRYDKAEKEYVSAKFDLKLKSDKKEELTQHLFTIIQENELRKSRKLEELLSKLNVTADHVTDVTSVTDHEIGTDQS